MDEKRATALRSQFDRPDVTVYHGDSNEVLIKDVFPKCLYKDFRRALCLLDPYGLNPKWKVIETAGKMRSVEIFLNFMIMDANMNVLWHKPEKVKPEQSQRMTEFWGDESWRDAAYTKEQGLFETFQEKTSNEAVLDAYCKRLRDVAGFEFVPAPIPMKNDQGPTIYYLVFASHNKTGNRIAEHVFKKYRNRVAH
jgi:three-Cys-motif partner protein